MLKELLEMLREIRSKRQVVNVTERREVRLQPLPRFGNVRPIEVIEVNKATGRRTGGMFT